VLLLHLSVPLQLVAAGDAAAFNTIVNWVCHSWPVEGVASASNAAVDANVTAMYPIE